MRNLRKKTSFIDKLVTQPEKRLIFHIFQSTSIYENITKRAFLLQKKRIKKKLHHNRYKGIRNILQCDLKLFLHLKTFSVQIKKNTINIRIDTNTKVTLTLLLTSADKPYAGPLLNWVIVSNIASVCTKELMKISYFRKERCFAQFKKTTNLRVLASQIWPPLAPDEQMH